MNRDTVEPFWNLETLDECMRTQHPVQPQQFAAQLENFLGGGKVLLTASGRDALAECFERAVRPASTILLCSFNCWMVAAAALRAGHRIETFDLASPRGGIDWTEVARRLDGKHGAVVVPHFFGAPSDFRPLIDAARTRGIVLIEDCAHALGARIGDQTAGTLADLAIFSFNYDKPISLAGGGALVINNQKLVDRFDERRHEPSVEEEYRQLQLYLRAASQRRSWIRHSDGYWRRLQRGLRAVRLLPRDVTTKPRGIGPLRATLASWQLDRYPEIARRRNENARYVSAGLEDIAWVQDADTTPAWLRHKFSLPAELVQPVEEQLRRRGLRVGRFNWSQTVDERLGQSPPEHAAVAAARGLDIPIHQNMTTADLDAIRTAISTATIAATAA